MTPVTASLADWPIGRPALLLGATDASDGDGVAHRLARLGLRAGATLTPLLRTAGRGVVLASGELRIALDRASAAAVRVGEVRPHLARPEAPETAETAEASEALEARGTGETLESPQRPGRHEPGWRREHEAS